MTWRRSLATTRPLIESARRCSPVAPHVARRSALKPCMDKARAMLKASGYHGEKVVILSPSDVPTIGPMGEITYDLLKKLGMNAELAATDWATLTNRRALREPVEKGGWSIFHTWAASTIIGTPVEHFAMRGLGRDLMGLPTRRQGRN